MRTLLVVVLDELPEHVFQVTLPEDEQVVGELAVPVEQSLRADQEGGPSGRGEDPAQDGNERTVTRLKAKPADLAIQDTELMAEGKNLDPEVGRLCLLVLDHY